MIESQVAKLGPGPLTESGLREHVWPLFSRMLQANEAREIYLANHSLGRPLDQTANDVAEALSIWFSKLDGAWAENAWPAEMKAFRTRVAQLLGLSSGENVVAKTSAGQGLRAVLNALPVEGAIRPLNIVSTRGEFDSVDFILKTYAKKDRAVISWVDPEHVEFGVPLYSAESVLDTITDSTDLVVLSMVAFSTGQLMPGLEAIINRAHEVGAFVLADVYHAAGVIPVNMEALGIDFVIGGSYKYIRGGPGACWLAIHPRVLGLELRTLDTGWFAKKSPFSYDRSDDPELAEGGDGWLESTPAVVTAYQASAGLRLTLALGVDRLRDYNLTQQQVLRDAFRDQGVFCYEPADTEQFGAFMLLPTDHPKDLCLSLHKAGVNTDARGATVRFGPDLLNSVAELVRAAEITSKVMRKD